MLEWADPMSVWYGFAAGMGVMLGLMTLALSARERERERAMNRWITFHGMLVCTGCDQVAECKCSKAGELQSGGEGSS